MTSDAALLRSALQDIAPGTPLREGLERIQRSHTGGLIVLGVSPQLEEMCSGGFDLDIEFTASRLRELCKMDGAVIIDPTDWRIRKANVQLFPDQSIPTDESGMRHRTAQRTAYQTHLPVLSVSASMRLISIYVGKYHHIVEEPEALLSRANLAVDTLDRYSQRLDEVLQTLTILEMRDSATVRDVATVMQRMEMIRRITSEINEYLEELGSEGRLLALQVDDLVRGSGSERALVLRDYTRDASAVSTAEAALSELASDRLVDLAAYWAWAFMIPPIWIAPSNLVACELFPWFLVFRGMSSKTSPAIGRTLQTCVRQQLRICSKSKALAPTAQSSSAKRLRTNSQWLPRELSAGSQLVRQLQAHLN